MSSNINLIDKRSVEDSKKTRLKKLKNFSFALLFFVGLLSLIVFLLNYRFSVRYVRKQQEDIIKKITIYDETAVKIILLNSRLSDVSKVLNRRSKYNEKMSKILDGVKGATTIDGFEVNENEVSITASSTSLSSLDDFLNNLLKMVDLKLFSNVILEEISEDGARFSVKIRAS